MKEQIDQLGIRHVADIQDINRNLMEKALEMRCQSYLSHIKAKLLTETIYEIDHSKKSLMRSNDELTRQNQIIEQQKVELEEKNRQLEQIQTELEGRVQQRTCRLEELNRQLQEEIAERRRAESDRMAIVEKYLQAQKMETIGRLAAGTAHEINNPLSSILQNLQLIRGRLRAERSSQQEVARECGLDLDALQTYLQRQKIDEMLEAIHDSGRRAADIVESMLNFSRKSESSFATHDIEQLFNASLKMMLHDFDSRSHYDFKKIQVVTDFPEPLPQLFCSGLKLQQVFLNILKNGAQAMLADKQLNRPPCFRIKAWQDGDRLFLRICDNGPGMPEEVRRNIFEPFFTTKTVGNGTGLGLSVSYYIITDIHGGTMQVDSNPGQGTSFTLSLPLKAPRDPSAATDRCQ